MEAAAPAARRPWWRRAPLYLQIVVALALGVLTGLALPPRIAEDFNVPAQIILRLLGAIAPPLILLAVMRALIGANVRGRLAGKMFSLLALNTLVAILIGLLVANAVGPGRHASLPPGAPPKVGGNMLAQLLDNIPASLVRPLVDNNVIGVILVAVAFAMAARRLDDARKGKVLGALEIGFDLILIVLHWIIAAVPLAVFCKVTYVVGTQGFKPFLALGWFIVAVLIALGAQATYYLVRIWMSSGVSPRRLLAGTRDALAMAFSTASSTVTMPVTYASLREKVGLREESASLGALVGSNFNNDGTALYEAMAALFIAQMTGTDLTLAQQAMVVLTSVIASVGAAGIPEAGLVTMTLVFSAVNLPTGYIALLLPVDWFLDRCRTTINVMGDMNVSCVLDGKTREVRKPDAADALLSDIA
ncbi:MAG: dicarboxylate/amino acid:cation symporter [Polyangiaceae bacterium]|nr:dicarboxylate/amino acid:cation symporter [Polyangiaceae bacterium]